MLETADGADVLVVLTEWNEFRAVDLAGLRKVMRGNVLVDMRNVYQPVLAEAAGFAYHGIGRRPLAERMETLQLIKERSEARLGYSVDGLVQPAGPLSSDAKLQHYSKTPMGEI